MKSIIRTVTALITLFLIAGNIYAKTRIIGSVREYEGLENEIRKGDTIIWRNGTYNDISWIIRTDGLVILAENQGRVVFSGNSSVKLNASDLFFTGFQFRGGAVSGDVVTVAGSNNVVSDLNISGYASHYYFNITAKGRNNIIERCNFENKPPAAPGKEGTSIFQVAVDSVSPGYNIIRYCSFKNHQAPPNSGGDYGMEALRIGYSFQAKFISRTIVEYCFFTRCNGDGEIISNKARENIFRYNTFTDNGDSHLTLRHGSDNVVYGNFFINGAGIRIKEGQNQMVYNNYFNTGNYFSIRLENYRVDPLKNILIVHNTFSGSGPLRLGGKGDYQPEKVAVCNNLFINPLTSITDDPTGKELFLDNAFQPAEKTDQTGFYEFSDPIGSNEYGYNQPLNKIVPAKPVKSSFQILDIPELNDDPEILLDISGNTRAGKNRSAGCFEPGKKSKPVKPYATEINTGPAYITKNCITGYHKNLP